MQQMVLGLCATARYCYPEVCDAHAFFQPAMHDSQIMYAPLDLRLSRCIVATTGQQVGYITVAEHSASQTMKVSYTLCIIFLICKMQLWYISSTAGGTVSICLLQYRLMYPCALLRKQTKTLCLLPWTS